MGRRFASFFAEFGVDSTKLQRGLTDAKARMMNFKSGLNDVAQGLTGFSLNTLAGAGAVIALGRAVQQSVKDYMAYADTVRELTRVNGASAEETSRVIQFTDDLGLSLEDLNTASTMAARQGITLTTDSLARMSDEFLKLQTPAEKNAYALENFGRSGLNMIKVLEAGSVKIKEMSAGVEENLILTDKQVLSARQLEIAQDNLNDTWTGLKTTLVTGVIPPLTSFLAKMNEGITVAGQLASQNKTLTSILNEHETEVRNTAKSYEEYSAEMIRAANAAGMLNIDETTAQLYGMGAAEDEAILKLGYLNETTFAAIQANGSFVEMAEQVRSKAVEVDGALDGAATGMGNLSTNANTAATVMGELSTKLIYTAAAANLDGAAAVELAKSMGLVNNDTYAAMKALDEIQAKFDTNKNGIIENSEATNEYVAAVTNLDEAVKKLKDKKITITVDQIYNTIGTQGSGYTATGETSVQARASGGPVISGSPYWVGEQGAEPFIPAQNGRILSREDAMKALSSGAGNVTITQNIYTQIDYAEAAAQIAEVVRRA